MAESDVVIEVLFAPSTQAYRDDPSTIDPVFTIVSAAEGCLGVYHAPLLEDPTRLLVLVAWTTLAAHQTLIHSPAYTPLLAAFTNAGDITAARMLHAPVPRAGLASALSAPCTSYAHVTQRRVGADARRAEGVFNALVSVQGVPGLYGGVVGRVVEGDEHVVFMGWDGPEFHEEGKKLEEPARLREEVEEEVEEWTGGHVRFNVYKEFEA